MNCVAVRMGCYDIVGCLTPVYNKYKYVQYPAAVSLASGCYLNSLGSILVLSGTNLFTLPQGPARESYQALEFAAF